MRDYSGYVSVSHGAIPQTKLTKAMKGGKLSFSKEELAGSQYKTLFHPTTAKLIKSAQSKRKGINNVPVAMGEIVADIDWHDSMGSGMQGGSIWNWIKTKAYPWIKKNWSEIRPYVSKALDAGVPALTSALAGSKYGAPLAPFVAPARELLKKTTGTGMTTREKKLKALEKARASKKNKINVLTGSSFRIN